MFTRKVRIARSCIAELLCPSSLPISQIINQSNHVD
jgi:hypothetical protein